MLPLPPRLQGQVSPDMTPEMLRIELLNGTVFQGSQDMRGAAWAWVVANDEADEHAQRELLAASAAAAQESASATKDAAEAARDSARWTKWAAIAAAVGTIAQTVLGIVSLLKSGAH